MYLRVAEITLLGMGLIVCLFALEEVRNRGCRRNEADALVLQMSHRLYSEPSTQAPKWLWQVDLILILGSYSTE